MIYKPYRRSIRIPKYDYSRTGTFFLTICAFERQCLFGEIIDDRMYLNDLGRIVEQEWNKSAQIRSEINLDEFIVMPNHLHGMVSIEKEFVGAHRLRPSLSATKIIRPPQDNLRKPRSIGAFVAGFKSSATRRINECRKTSSHPVWQRNYFEHVVRDDEDMNRIRQYITDNPIRWIDDENNPDRVPP